MRITLLASGDLGYKALRSLAEGTAIIEAVFTNAKSVDIIKFCNIRKIMIFIGNPRNRKSKIFTSKIKCDVLLSINYLYIIERDLINLPSKYAINIHGSLLPKYRGRTPHVWAIINGERESGVTAHLISEKLDGGDIIEQKVVSIEPSDTGWTMLKKFQPLYIDIIHDLISKVKTNNISFKKQNESEATYFGKRTPEDGRINWNWSKERIRNWIRAQANPYPGAFAYYNNQKITINEAHFDPYGFHSNDFNGKILLVKTESIIVKTSNGALKLSAIEAETDILFKPLEILE